MQDLLLMTATGGEGPLTNVGSRGYPSIWEWSGGLHPSLEPLFFVHIHVYLNVFFTDFSFSFRAEGDLLHIEEWRGASWRSFSLTSRGTR